MIGKKELTGVIVTAIVVKMLLTYPRQLAINSGQAAWIEVLFVTVIAFLLILVTCRVYKHKHSIIELAYMVGGKGLKIAVGVVVFLIFLANFVSVARVFPETVKVVLLQDSRVDIIVAAFAVASGIGAYMGIKSLARVNYMFFPIAGAVFAAFLLLLLPYYNIENLFPILGEGAEKVFLSGFNSLSLFSDILLLNILLPYSKNLSEARTISRRAIIISGIISILIVAAYTLTYIFPVSRDFILPVYQLSRIISLSNFFGRYEAFFQFVWSILILIYSSVYIWAMCNALQSTFNLKYEKPLIVPVVLIGITLTSIPSAITSVVNIIKYINMIEYPLVFLLPIIFGALTNRRRGERNEIY